MDYNLFDFFIEYKQARYIYHQSDDNHVAVLINNEPVFNYIVNRFTRPIFCLSYFDYGTNIYTYDFLGEAGTLNDLDKLLEKYFALRSFEELFKHKPEHGVLDVIALVSYEMSYVLIKNIDLENDALQMTLSKWDNL